MAIINTFNRKRLRKHFLKAERRHHSRYSARDFECSVFCQGIQNPNRLLNISEGGLSFQLLSQPEEPVDCKAVDILCIRPDRLYLPGIFCRMIYDINALAENTTFSGAESRCCGVQFLNLNGEQKQALMEFLSSFDVSR